MPVLFSSGGNTVSVTTIMSILNAVTAQFSIENIVAFIAGILAITVAFVFLWWGIRKGFRALIKAATRGKPSV